MTINYEGIRLKEKALLADRELKKNEQLSISKSCQSCAKHVKLLEKEVIDTSGLDVYQACTIILNKGIKALDDVEMSNEARVRVQDLKSQIIRYESDLEKYAEQARTIKEEIADFDLAIKYVSTQVEIRSQKKSTEPLDPDYIIFDIDIYTFKEDDTWSVQKMSILYRNLVNAPEAVAKDKWTTVDAYGNENDIYDSKTKFIISYYLKKHIKQ